MANRRRTLDPQASPAALFGAELRALRLRRRLALASLGRLVHVSGDLLGKIEKAERRPQPDLLTRLDVVLEADGRLRRLGAELLDDVAGPSDPTDEVTLSPDTALHALRSMIDTVRADDHAMNDQAEPAGLLAHARAAEKVHGKVGGAGRPLLGAAIAEAYQLAGWMSFDHDRPTRAENLLSTSRSWIERAADPSLAAFVLGPNLSFVATCGGNAALGVERAYGAIGWARRSGNRRLSAFAMAIGARAHARLGEATLCLDLLEKAEGELDRHAADDADGSWLSVFDRSALAGHRGSCLLDLGEPDRALGPLARQDAAAPQRFVRNRVIWQLDRIEALLRLHETDQACTELLAATALPATMTPRVVRRFRAVELHLHTLPPRGLVAEATDRLHDLTAAHA
jgi:transcriptional regulator with XRE-family HTH domain